MSVDLIFALPERLGREWAADLEMLLALEPDHVSLYGLTAEEGTPLGRWVRESREVMADEDRYADEFLLATERFRGAGFEHYEVSNFARPGKRSRHNAVYWTGESYAALGPGAHSFLPPRRRWNHRSWTAYKEALDGGALPIGGEERVDESTAMLEAVWLGLRTDAGFRVADAGEGARRLVEGWSGRGLATIADERVTLTAEGWLLLDRLATDLTIELGGGTDPRRPDTIDAGKPLVQISG